MRRDRGGEPAFDDARMEQAMGRLLQAGVLLASGVVLVGGVLYLRAHGPETVSYRHFVSEPAELRGIGSLMGGIARGDAASIIQLGVLLLIATPVARVLLAAVAFGAERDLRYLGISLLVLTLLLAGLFRIA